jgi:hypothetical protein
VNADMVYSYVRDLLERLTGERPAPDPDGDLPVALGGARFYVRVVDGREPVVQVFSVAVAELEPSDVLHAMLNDINVQLRFARAFFVQGQVLMESEIWGRDVNPATFGHACQNIAAATDHFAPRIVEQIGGQPRFEMTKTTEYTDGPAVGGYL